MRYEKIPLKEKFTFLGEAGRDPVMEIDLPCNMPEMKRRDTADWLHPHRAVKPKAEMTLRP